jgi:hypothetical protein
MKTNSSNNRTLSNLWSQNKSSQKQKLTAKVSELLSKMSIEEKIDRWLKHGNQFWRKGKPGVFDMTALTKLNLKYHIGLYCTNQVRQQYNDGKK